MSRKIRRKFTPEQRAQAVRIVRESGKSTRQVAEELAIPGSCLARWVSQAGIDERRDPSGPMTSEERSELAKLRRDNRVLQQERDFLKKTAAFFARESS